MPFVGRSDLLQRISCRLSRQASLVVASKANVTGFRQGRDKGEHAGGAGESGMTCRAWRLRPPNLERTMSDQPTGTGRVILPEGLTWEQVHLAVEIIQNWEIAGSSDAVELVVDLYKLFKQGSEAEDLWNEPPGG
jgi:hypothetical protein